MTGRRWTITTARAAVLAIITAWTLFPIYYMMSLAITPSFGEWYAHKYITGGMALRVLGLTTALWAFAQDFECDSCTSHAAKSPYSFRAMNRNAPTPVSTRGSRSKRWQTSTASESNT